MYLPKSPVCLGSYKQSKYSFINFFTAKYVKIVTMSKIFKYTKKSKLCFYVKICIYLKVRALVISVTLRKGRDLIVYAMSMCDATSTTPQRWFVF